MALGTPSKGLDQENILTMLLPMLLPMLLTMLLTMLLPMLPQNIMFDISRNMLSKMSSNGLLIWSGACNRWLFGSFPMLRANFVIDLHLLAWPDH